MSGVFSIGEEAYEDFMGRYSRRLAPLFADFAGVRGGDRVLDVGAGTGALTAELLDRGSGVAAVEPSRAFCEVLRKRFPELEVHEGPAEQLPFPDGAFDVALAQLVVAFLADAPRAAAEMARVARRVAVCMWGIQEVEMFAAIQRAAEAVGTQPQGARLYRTAQELRDLLAPLGEVESAELDVVGEYASFEEFWHALEQQIGLPAAAWLASLDDAGRERAREELFRQLGSPEGAFELKARAFAAAVTPG